MEKVHRNSGIYKQQLINKSKSYQYSFLCDGKTEVSCVPPGNILHYISDQWNASSMLGNTVL